MRAKHRRAAAGFTAACIAQACGGRLTHGQAQTRASAVSTDTRTLQSGQAFFALVGPHHDAHDHLAEAIERDAAIVVVQRVRPRWRIGENLAVIRVADTTRALLQLAAWHAQRVGGSIVAVTGSLGKTTVKEMIGAILSERAPCTVAPASYNNRVGVALTLLSASPQDAYVVLELGTNHPGEIDELAGAARPDVGVITAIAPAHLEGLGSIEGVREAKAELIPHLRGDGALVLNADDPRCLSLAGRYGGAVHTFGFRPEATVRLGDPRRTPTGWAFDALGRTFRLAVGGRHNVLNAGAALCAVRALGAPLDGVGAPLARFRLPPLRYQRRYLDGVRFVLDCYNSNPAAMRAAVDSFLQEPANGARAVVCGEMLELGAHGPELHYELGRYLAECGIDMLVALGGLGRHLLRGWDMNRRAGQIGLHFPSAHAAWQPLWRLLQPGDCVLVKGSRATRMEALTARIADYLSDIRREVA